MNKFTRFMNLFSSKVELTKTTKIEWGIESLLPLYLHLIRFYLPKEVSTTPDFDLTAFLEQKEMYTQYYARPLDIDSQPKFEAITFRNIEAANNILTINYEYFVELTQGTLPPEREDESFLLPLLNTVSFLEFTGKLVKEAMDTGVIKNDSVFARVFLYVYEKERITFEKVDTKYTNKIDKKTLKSFFPKFRF